MQEEKNKVYIYTDGACSGNPGPGGWGAVLRCNGTEKRLQGWCTHTTNNRMEILAIIRALEALKRRVNGIVTTDSQYVKDGITKWIHGWKRNGWQTAGKKPVKNRDLWQRLDKLVNLHGLEWRWVRGHAGHRYNEIADELATGAIDRGRSGKLREDREGLLQKSA